MSPSNVRRIMRFELMLQQCKKLETSLMIFMTPDDKLLKILKSGNWELSNDRLYVISKGIANNALRVFLKKGECKTY